MDAALGTRSLLVICSTWRKIPWCGTSDTSMRHMGRSAGRSPMALQLPQPRHPRCPPQTPAAVGEDAQELVLQAAIGAQRAGPTVRERARANGAPGKFVMYASLGQAGCRHATLQCIAQ